MITIKELRKVGFKDVSHDKNGLAYRRKMPGFSMEIMKLSYEPHLRFQTTGSGITIPLFGVQTIEQLDRF